MREQVRRLAFAAAVAFTSVASSAQANAASRVHAGVAGLLPNFGGRVAGSADGSANIFGNLFFPALSVSARIGGGGWLLVPAIQFTPFASSSSEGAASRRLLIMGIALGKSLGSFELRAGPGVVFYTVGGAGGPISLNNGNSVSTFYAPAGDVSARLYSINAGIGFDLRDGFRLDADGIVTAAFGERRAVSLSVGVAYEIF